MTTNNRTFRVFFLNQDDKTLLQGLGKNDGCPRHLVLSKMIETLNKLEVPSRERAERHAIRIDMPNELLEALQARSEATKIPITRLIVLAAQKFRDDGIKVEVPVKTPAKSKRKPTVKAVSVIKSKNPNVKKWLRKARKGEIAKRREAVKGKLKAAQAKVQTVNA